MFTAIFFLSIPHPELPMQHKVSSTAAVPVGALVAVCRVPDLQSGGGGLESWPRLLRTKVYSAFQPFRVGKWVPAIVGKAKAGMAHSDCGRTCGCAGKTVRCLELSASAVVIHYKKALHQVHAPLPYLYCSNEILKSLLTGWQLASVSSSSELAGRHSTASKYNHCCIGMNLPVIAYNTAAHLYTCNLTISSFIRNAGIRFKR